MTKDLDINTLLTLILGGGLVGTLTALVKGYQSLKDGARTREKGTVEELILQRKKAFEERDTEFEEKTFAYDQRDYWRNWSADLEFIMRKNGIEVPPRGPEPTRITRP